MMAKNNLRQVLDNEKITQAELARESGFSTNTVNKIYLKKTNGAPTTRGKMVDAVNRLSGQSYTLYAIFPNG